MLSNILGSEAFFIVNKKIVKILGIEAALLIGDLVSKKKYFQIKEQLKSDGSFFNTQENIKEDTGMSPHQQRKALKLLQDNGFLTIKRRDVPAKNYF
ncbi:MAG: replication/maintenance protein RepL, partial [Cetobacterium sp.]